MACYLLDTTALIDYLRGFPRAVELIQRLAQGEHTLAVCCINIAEVYAGLRDHEQQQTDEFMDRLAYLETSPAAAKRAGDYRRRFRLSTTDALVAATAIAHQATLVTANVRHYPMPEIALLELPSS